MWRSLAVMPQTGPGRGVYRMSGRKTERDPSIIKIIEKTGRLEKAERAGQLEYFEKAAHSETLATISLPGGGLKVMVL